jgi:hypothetical protein
MFGGANLSDKIQIVPALGPVTPSTSVPDYISLKNVRACDVVVQVLNGTTVTGSAITLKQASAVANTGEKALAFTTYYRISDPANSVAVTAVAASSNTFTTATTNSLLLLYRIPVDPASLDIANGFDCIRAGTGDAANTTVCVSYVIEPMMGGNYATMPNAIID